MSLSVQIEPAANGSQRVAIAGRLDTHTYQELDRLLAPVLETMNKSLVLDLAGLEYISSADVRSIFKARKALAARGGKVLVVNPQPQIQKVFDVVKAVPMNEIFASVAEADAYLDAMQRKVLEGDDEYARSGTGAFKARAGRASVTKQARPAP
ncbi:STAS domain-containing protein [Arenimonas caeni]|uniref:Anti-sigma factor antagonist n=1 Tax=Arenimonas caeni TaxID=2058085 RepID=A0A2P6M8S9_9GAMM|nr:STAS domain-containing protein [Arenimonas caeni]PRH82393.1 anti-sigma factor antagonist [Arenimonas caeni]